MLEGQVALITGASSGIGKAITRALSEAGVSICMVGRNRERLNSISRSFTNKPFRIYEVDLSEDEDIGKLTSNLFKTLDSLNILIHSAGDFTMGSFEDLSAEEFDRLYRINVRAPFLITKNLLPLIKKAKGQIVFINSSAGLQARAKISQYAATKHALKAIADSLREEINSDGVRVISIYPGRTATPMQEEVHKMEGKEYRADLLMQPEDVAETVINTLRLPRTAEITDVHIRPMKKV